MALIIAAATAQGEDWPQWRGPRGDGTWHAPQIAKTWPSNGLRALWKQPIGDGFAGVVVAGGKVFVADRKTDPEEVERLLAFDAATGRPAWSDSYSVQYGKLDYGTGPRAAPTIHDGRVYTLGAVGHVRCLDAQTGRIVWSHDCMREFDAKLSEWGFAASPVVYRGLVVFHVAARPGGCFIAFDRFDGHEVWRSGDDPAGYATPLLIDHGDEAQLIGWTPEHVVGISPATGELEWSIAYKVTYGVSIATPICQEALVFVSGYWEGSKAIRLGANRSKVELAWEENKNLRGLMSQPIYRSGHAYLLDKVHGLTCFKLATGEKLWDDENRLTPRGRNPQASLVWLGAGDTALALNSEGELIQARLTPERYEELARAKIIGPTWAHPAYAGRCVFARDDQELVCVELPVVNEQEPSSAAGSDH
jgi:outer membrane protein assembly factor BamB